VGEQEGHLPVPAHRLRRCNLLPLSGQETLRGAVGRNWGGGPPAPLRPQLATSADGSCGLGNPDSVWRWRGAGLPRRSLHRHRGVGWAPGERTSLHPPKAVRWASGGEGPPLALLRSLRLSRPAGRAHQENRLAGRDEALRAVRPEGRAGLLQLERAEHALAEETVVAGRRLGLARHRGACWHRCDSLVNRIPAKRNVFATASSQLPRVLRRSTSWGEPIGGRALRRYH
jgi:hypothetical protein